jgi:pimeloyl-ACP methyl ester carboxylesterase
VNASPTPAHDPARLTKGYTASRFGQLHHVETGTAAPGEPTVLLLHQTPRSWDEYRDVLPLLGARTRTVAMDTVGFGASARPSEPMSIEQFADGVEDLIDGLGLTDVVLVGHHTGGVVAVEVAARRGRGLRGLVLSGTPYVDQARRERVAAAGAHVDHVERTADGDHVRQLWVGRERFYPAGSTEVLERVVADALRVIDRVDEGHYAVNAYRMEDRIGAVDCPTLVVCGEQDGYSLPDVPRLLAALPGAADRVLAGTGVPSVDDRPEEFARAVLDFLDTLPAGGARP